MIHMLSRFDLKAEVEIDCFQRDYAAFAEEMLARDLISGTGRVGRRHADTPMDTDGDWAQTYYVVMSFTDRRQLDAAYAFMESAKPEESARHRAVYRALKDAVFTCWEDLPGS